MEEYIQIERFYRGYAKVRNSDGLKGVINKNNEILVPCEYKRIEYFFNKIKQSFVLVKNSEDKWGCLNKKGEEIIPCEYYRISLSEDFIILQDFDDKWGCLNKKGKTIIPCIYKDLNLLDSGWFRVLDFNDNYGMLNREGVWVVPCIYKAIFYDFYTYIIKNDECKIGLLDKNGKEIIPCVYKNMKSYHFLVWENYRIVQGFDDMWGVVNTKGEEIYPGTLSFIGLIEFTEILKGIKQQ